MEVKERVSKVKEYFVTLTVTDDTICVVIRFPKTWQIPDEKLIQTTFGVVIKPQQDCYFFFGELSDGFDKVFDAIENIIQANKAIEEKSRLLSIKANELKDLFLNEPLEKLKTLTFVFNEVPQQKKRGPKSKIKKEIEVQDSLLVPQEEEIIIDDVNSDSIEVEENIEQEETSSLMSLALNVINS